MISLNTVYVLTDKKYVITGPDIINDHIEVYDIQDKNENFWQFTENGTIHVFNAITFEYLGSSNTTPGGKACLPLDTEVISFNQFPGSHAIPKPSSFIG